MNEQFLASFIFIPSRRSGPVEQLTRARPVTAVPILGSISRSTVRCGRSCFVIRACNARVSSPPSQQGRAMRNSGNHSRPPNSAIILAIGGRFARSSLHQPPSHVCKFAISSTGPEMPRPIVASRPSTVTYAAPCHAVYASLLHVS